MKRKFISTKIGDKNTRIYLDDIIKIYEKPIRKCPKLPKFI
jgi:hypothetical protein